MIRPAQTVGVRWCCALRDRPTRRIEHAKVETTVEGIGTAAFRLVAERFRRQLAPAV